MRPGAKVVCLDDTAITGHIRLKHGMVYTVKKYERGLIWLNEYPDYVVFCTYCFRLAVEDEL